MAKQRWESIGETEDTNKMVCHFTNAMTKALDECAPMKTTAIRPDYKPGLTEEAKTSCKMKRQEKKTETKPK